MADQEEMKKQEKQNQIENERKRAENLKNQESRNQVSIFFKNAKSVFKSTGWTWQNIIFKTGWAGLLRQGPVVPVSPVVAPRTANTKNNAPKKTTAPKSASQKPKVNILFAYKL